MRPLSFVRINHISEFKYDRFGCIIGASPFGCLCAYYLYPTHSLSVSRTRFDIWPANLYFLNGLAVMVLALLLDKTCPLQQNDVHVVCVVRSFICRSTFSDWKLPIVSLYVELTTAAADKLGWWIMIQASNQNYSNCACV